MESMEQRIAAIESTIGLGPLTKTTTETENATSNDISARLDLLSNLTKSKLQRGRGALEKDLNTCETLEREIHPGSLLTHQSQTVVPPLLYQRQEILACQESLRESLARLATLRNLLRGNKSGSGGSAARTTAADSPFISCEQYEYATDTNNVQRLNALAASVAGFQSRSSRLSERLDKLLHHYQLVMDAVSEKMVLADEELSQMGM